MLSREQAVLNAWIDSIVSGRFRRVFVLPHEPSYTVLEQIIHVMVSERSLADNSSFLEHARTYFPMRNVVTSYAVEIIALNKLELLPLLRDDWIKERNFDAATVWSLLTQHWRLLYGPQSLAERWSACVPLLPAAYR